MSKPTPGPWVTDARYQRAIIGADGRQVAIASLDQTRETEEGNANARLIAAAPTLLAACESARHAILYALGARENEMVATAADAHCAQALENIRAAIAQATTPEKEG